MSTFPETNNQQPLKHRPFYNKKSISSSSPIDFDRWVMTFSYQPKECIFCGEILPVLRVFGLHFIWWSLFQGRETNLTVAGRVPGPVLMPPSQTSPEGRSDTYCMLMVRSKSGEKSACYLWNPMKNGRCSMTQLFFFGGFLPYQL